MRATTAVLHVDPTLTPGPAQRPVEIPKRRDLPPKEPDDLRYRRDREVEITEVGAEFDNESTAVSTATKARNVAQTKISPRKATGAVVAIPAKSKSPSPATRAMRLVGELGLDLFRTPEGEAFTSFQVGSHWETYSLEDPTFKELFSQKYYDRHHQVLPEKQFTEILSVLIGKAKFGGGERRVYVRVAELDGAIYIDLGDDSWKVVKITSEGWKIVTTGGVKFRRTKGMQALPRPTKGGSIELLRPYLNLASEDDWKLVVAWLVAAMRPTGPYPILVLEGPQGTAKTTNAKALRSLIDPSAAPLRSAPSNDRDLMISAINSWCVALENLSSIPFWLSDALCRLANGSGLSTRKLYSDADERIFEAARPIVLNGIQVGVKNGDLLERSLMLTLPRIADENRMPEADFWRKFEKDRPAILGALLDAVVGALKRLPEIKLSRLPRMADFVMWVTAAEQALGWTEGSLVAAYARNRQITSEMAADSSLLTQPIEKLLADRDGWQGTASELLDALNSVRRDDPYTGTSYFPKGWPQTPSALSGMLNRLEPDLKSVGIEVEFGQTAGANSRKIIIIRRHALPGTAKKASPDASALRRSNLIAKYGPTVATLFEMNEIRRD